MFISDQGTKLLWQCQSLLLALPTSSFGYFVAVEVDVLIFVYFFSIYSSALRPRNTYKWPTIIHESLAILKARKFISMLNLRKSFESLSL